MNVSGFFSVTIQLIMFLVCFRYSEHIQDITFSFVFEVFLRTSKVLCFRYFCGTINLFQKGPLMVYFWYVRGSIYISLAYLWHIKLRYVLGMSYVCFWYVTDMFWVCQSRYVLGRLLIGLTYG